MAQLFIVIVNDLTSELYKNSLSYIYLQDDCCPRDGYQEVDA